MIIYVYIHFQITKSDVLQVLKICSKITKIEIVDCNDFAPNPEDRDEIRSAYPNKKFQMTLNYQPF